MKRILYTEIQEYVSRGEDIKGILDNWKNRNRIVQLVSEGSTTFREQIDNLRKVPDIKKRRSMWPDQLEGNVLELEECLGDLNFPYIPENVIVGGFIGSALGLVYGRLMGPRMADKHMPKPEEFPSPEQYRMTRRKCLWKFTGISSFFVALFGMFGGALHYSMQRDQDYAKADYLDKLISPRISN